MDKSKKIISLKILIVCIAAAAGIFFIITDNTGFFRSASNHRLMPGFYIFLFNIAFLGAALFVDYSKINILDNNLYKNIISFFLFFIIPNVLIIIFEGVTSCKFKVHSYIYAVLFIFIIQCIIFIFTRSLRMACIITTLLYFAFLTANDTVLHSRGIPIVPQDIFSAATAAAVSQNYPLYISPRTYSNFIFLCACAYLLFKLNPTFSKKNYTAILFSLSFIIVVSGSLVLAKADKKKFVINTFDASDTIKNNGIFLSFLLHFKNMQVARPVDYNKDEAVETFNVVNSEEMQNDSVSADDISNYPNIIVIMNESFADLNVLGHVDTDDQFLTNFNNLKEEGLSGKMIVSVLGGNTANTEFEFLTSLSMAFLPNGSVAYTQYIDEETPTIATWLSSLGYKTIAFHPFWERCWKRNEIYSLLGFDDFISIEDISDVLKNSDKTAEIKFDLEGKPFGDFEYIRGLLSDGEDYREVKKIFEEKGENEKLFLFNVTIQNHGGYNVYLNEFHNTVKLNNTDEYEDVEQYLTLIQKSDEYLKELTDYFRDKDEPVIILFFGDHQPWLSKNYYEELQQNVTNNLTKKTQKYTVPYLIWSNFPLDKSKERSYVSPNLLAEYLLDVAGIKKNSFYDFIADFAKETPAINYFSYKTPDGLSHKLTPEKYTDNMKKYRDYQYYLLFENKK